MLVRAGATLAIAGLALGLGGCASTGSSGAAGLSTSGSTPTASAGTGAPSTPAASTPTPAVTVTVTKTATPAAALTCAQLKYAQVGSKTVSYNGYRDSIPLGGGVWSGEDGNTVTLQKPCAIGDLNGDGAADAIGVVVLTSGGTGEFYTLVVWSNVNSKPVFRALHDLGDRNPVQSITIAGGKATVVYLTRTADAPMAVVNIERTAIYALSGHSLTQQSHTDQPYSGG